MSRTKRFGVAIFGVLLVLAVYIAFKWKASHEEGLQPKLVLTVKASEYPNLTPTEHCFVHGKDVDDICSAHGVSGRPIVAARGWSKFVFRQETLDWVDPTWDVEPGDPELIYFFQYDERFRGTMQSP